MKEDNNNLLSDFHYSPSNSISCLFLSQLLSLPLIQLGGAAQLPALLLSGFSTNSYKADI